MPSLLSGEYIWSDNPHCRKLETQFARFAFSLALASAGSSIAARMAMMAMTTSNSIRVKAPIRRAGAFTWNPLIRLHIITLLIKSGHQGVLIWSNFIGARLVSVYVPVLG